MAFTKLFRYVAIFSIPFVQVSGLDHQSIDASQNLGRVPVQMLNFQLSPSCWIRAVERLYEAKDLVPEAATVDQNTLHTMVCQVMTFKQQQALALELTKCHMESVGRPISDSICEQNKISTSNGVRDCLANVDDSSLNAYTTFFQYVNQNCIRLTSEIITARYHESAMILAETSTVAMDKMSEIIAKQEEVLVSQGNATQCYEENKKQMQGFQNELKGIVTVVGTMSTTIKPLLGVKDHAMRVTESFTWYATFIYFFGTVCLSWLLTMNKRFKQCRTHISGIIVIEALAEFFLQEVTRRGILLGEQRSYAIGILRSWAFYFECGLYILGLVHYLFWVPEENEPTFREVHAQYTEFISRLEERSNEVMAEQKLREEALVQALHDLQRDSVPSTHTFKPLNGNATRIIELPPCLKNGDDDGHTKPIMVLHGEREPTVFAPNTLDSVNHEHSNTKRIATEISSIQPRLDLSPPILTFNPTFTPGSAEKNMKKRVLPGEENLGKNGLQIKKMRKNSY